VSDSNGFNAEQLVDLNAGALAPVGNEITLADLPVQGRIPPALNGWLVRNGPNPYSGRFSAHGMLNWWPEAAMVHGLRLQKGKALEYRNRWLRTRQWAEYFNLPNPMRYPATNPNVNVIRHAGKALALAEGGPPVVLDENLVSGEVPSQLAPGITAHPKVDPVSGELVWFRSSWAQPYLHYGVCDSQGEARVEQVIPVTQPAMMHDFATTERFSILLDLNVIYDLSLFERGLRIPIRWDDERPARLGVLPRLGGEVHWFDIRPCFIQHVANAYESGSNTIVLDAVRYPSFQVLNEEGNGFLPNPLGELWRFELNLQTGNVKEQRILRRFLEMPRINDTLTGRPHRYVYGVLQPTDEEMRGVVRVDTLTGEALEHVPPPGDQNSEPVFVADPQRLASEAGGWLLFYAYRVATDTCDLMILDAEAPDKDPVASVPLPRRIPAGFHGAWLPG